MRRLLRPTFLWAIFLGCTAAGLLTARLSEQVTQDPSPTTAGRHTSLIKATKLRVTLLVRGQDALAHNFTDASADLIFL